MKFHPPAIIRHFYRYIFVGLFVGFPLYFATIKTQDVSMVAIEDKFAFAILSSCLALPGCIIIHIGFWEKFFGVLFVDEREIVWKCPFRKTRTISMVDCKEIGGCVENKKSGIPFEIIYFSTKRNPQQYSDKNGVLKYSDQYIKFWYSEDLYRYLVEIYPSACIGRLIFFRQKRKTGGGLREP